MSNDDKEQTPEDWLAELFEFELCPECGRDADDHRVVVPPTGNYFARCMKPRMNYRYLHSLHLQNTSSKNTTKVEDLLDLGGYGRWTCVVDRVTSGGEHYNVLEVHKGSAWRETGTTDADRDFSENKAVFRVSRYSAHQGVQLGDCAILNKDQMVQARDLLNALIQEIETNSVLDKRRQYSDEP